MPRKSTAGTLLELSKGNWPKTVVMITNIYCRGVFRRSAIPRVPSSHHQQQRWRWSVILMSPPFWGFRALHVFICRLFVCRWVLGNLFEWEFPKSISTFANRWNWFQKKLRCHQLLFTLGPSVVVVGMLCSSVVKWMSAAVVAFKTLGSILSYSTNEGRGR